MSAKKNDYKKPEVIIQGQSVKFHSSRDERLSRVIYKPKETESFFSKKNRGMHITGFNIILIIIMIFVFTFSLRVTKSSTMSGFKISFNKKIFNEGPFINFKVQAKNISLKENTLPDDLRIMDFSIIDKNEKLIHNELVYFTKNNFKGKEYHTEYIQIKIIDPGAYKAVILFGQNKEKSLTLSFTAK